MNMNRSEPPVSRWPGLRLIGQVPGGSRSEVWRGDIDGFAVAVRRSRRSAVSLAWELDLMSVLRGEGFRVPDVFATGSGERHVDGWCVQTWVAGESPSTRREWLAVAEELHRLHFLLRLHPQRPGCVTINELTRAGSSVDADLSEIPDEVIEACVAHFEPHLEGQVSLIHGDPGADNIRILEDGSVAFIDWDEARLDVAELDFANLGVDLLSGARRRCGTALAHAWEALNCWELEPDYAQGRFEQLGSIEHPSSWPELTDGVVTLRPRTTDEAVAQRAGEDQEIVDWLTGGFASLERMEQHIDICARVWAVSGLRRSFGVYVDDVMVGNVELNFADMDLGFDEVNVSYATFAPARRKGYAARALTLITDYSLEVEPGTIPTLKIDSRNAASIGVARTAGFEKIRDIVRPDRTYEARHRLSDRRIGEIGTRPDDGLTSSGGEGQ